MKHPQVGVLKTVTSGPDDCEREDIATTTRLNDRHENVSTFHGLSPYEVLFGVLFGHRMKSDARTRGIAPTPRHFVDFCLSAFSAGMVTLPGGMVITLWSVMSPS